MKSFKQMRNEEFVPKFQRATKTDVHYTGTINGKTYVVPHSFHGNHDVLHGTKVTPIRYNHVVSPHHVQFNNPTLSPEEIARVNQHIKDIHPGKLDEESYFYHMGGSHQGQYVTAKSESEAHKKIEKRHGSKAVSVKLTVPDASKEDQLKEESITENILYEKGNYTVRSHPKGHFEVYRNQGTAAVKCATIGKGPGPHLGYERAKAEVDKRHQEEQLKETRQMTLHLGVKRTAPKEVPVTKVTEPEHTASYDELFNSRKAATLAFAKKHHITEKEDESKETAPVKRAEKDGKKDGKKEHHPDTNKSKWLKRLFPHSPENRQGFLPEKVEDAMLGEGKNVFDYHQTQIAKKTLRMPDAMVGVMGGMDKEESRRHLKKMGWSDQRIKQHENAQFVSEHVWNVTDHLGNKHEVEAKDRSEAMQKTVSVGSHSHPEGIPMHLWSKVRVEKKEKSLEESKMQNYPHVYDVHLHGKKIDTLRTATHLDPTEYKKMLVQAHDYHPEITVTKKPTLMSEAVKSVLMNEKSLLQEKTLTPAESEKKEDIVHGMKKSIKSFKSHYGERAKNVMYATATARAKELSESRKIVVHHVYDEQKRVAHSIHATAADAKETKKQLELGGAQKGRYTINKYLRKLEENYKYDNMMYATATARAKKLAESKYNYETAMTSRLPAHLTDDPKGEKELEQGHLQHCGKCGRVRVFTKGSMTCPVCGTKKVTEEVEQIDELSKNTLGSYVRGAARNKDLQVGDKVHLGLGQKGGAGHEGTVHKIEGSQVHVNVGKGEVFGGNRIVVGTRKHVTVREGSEQLDELSKATLGSYVRGAARNKDLLMVKSGNMRMVGNDKEAEKYQEKSFKRTKGIRHAVEKLEESEQLDETVEYKSGHLLHPDDQRHVLNAYVHRYTKEHVPQWAEKPMPNGQSHKPHHETDADWLKHTKFAVKKNGRLHAGATHAQSTPSLPLTEAEQLDETFMGTYKRNESMNRHTANIVHLAKHFGTEADKSEAKFYADELKKHGHNKHHEASYRLHQKLWPLATAAHHYSEEVEQLNELKKSTLRNYLGKAAYDLRQQERVGHDAIEAERLKILQGSSRSARYGGRAKRAFHKGDKRIEGIHRAAGKLEEERKPYDAYDFAVGAKLSHHVDDNTHFHMNKEHGVYHIKGFKQGKHFWDTARTHGEAMKKFSAHKKGVSEEVEQLDEGDHKFINAASSRKSIADAEKALKDNPGMWSGPKAGFKGLITVHKKHLAKLQEAEQLDEISLGLAHKVHDARIERGDEYQRQAVSGPHHNQAQAKMKQEYAKADKVGGFITRKHNRLDAVGPEGRRGTAYAPTYKFHEEAEQLDEMTIGAGSHKVIKAFLNKQSASSKKLSTDGKTLHGNWLGGSGIAHHEGGKVHLNDLGGRTAIQVHRAIKKHLTYGSGSNVPHYDTELHEAHSETYNTIRRVLGEKKG